VEVVVVMVAIVKIAAAPVVGLEINCLPPPVIPWWYARSADVIPPEAGAGDPGNANRHENVFKHSADADTGATARRLDG
jgi:hypothetical protein